MCNIIKHPVLVRLISKYNEINWIELGVWEGRNVREVFNIFDSKIKKMYLLDPYIPLTQYKEKFHEFFGSEEVVNKSKNIALTVLEPYKNKCIWIEDFSFNVINKFENESIDVIYVDGNHTTEAVLLDLILYYPKIKTGGLIIGDDYNENSVKMAINAFGKEYQVSNVRNIEEKKFYLIK